MLCSNAIQLEEPTSNLTPRRYHVINSLNYYWVVFSVRDECVGAIITAATTPQDAFQNLMVQGKFYGDEAVFMILDNKPEEYDLDTFISTDELDENPNVYQVDESELGLTEVH